MKETFIRPLLISLALCLLAWGQILLPSYTLSSEASLSAFLPECRVGGEKLDCINSKLRDIGSHDYSPYSVELPANYYFARESHSLLPWRLPKWNPYIGSGFPQVLDGHNPYYSPIQLALKFWPGDTSRDFLIFFRIWYWTFGILLIVSQFSDRKSVLWSTGLIAALAPYHSNYIDISFLDADLLAPFFPALVVLFQKGRLPTRWALFFTFVLGVLAGSMSFIQAQVVFCLSVFCYSIFFAPATQGKSILLAGSTSCGFLILWPAWSPIVTNFGEFLSARDFYECHATLGLSLDKLLRNIIFIPTGSTDGRYTFLTLPGLFLALSIFKKRMAWIFVVGLVFFGGLVLWGVPSSLCSSEWIRGVAFARHSVPHATTAFLVLIGISLSNLLETESKYKVLFISVTCLIISYLISSSSEPNIIFWCFSILGTFLLASRYLFFGNAAKYREIVTASSLVMAIAPTFWFSNKYLFLRVQQPNPRQESSLPQQLDPTSPIGLIQQYSKLEDRRHHSPQQILDGNWSGAFGILDLKINMPLYPRAYWALNSQLFGNWSGKGLVIYPNMFLRPETKESYFSEEFQRLMLIHRISLISFNSNEIQLNPSSESPYSEENCDLLARNSYYSSYVCRQVGGVGFFPKKVVQVKDQEAVLSYLKTASIAETNGLAVIYSKHPAHRVAAKGTILSMARNGDELTYDLQIEKEGIFVVADTYTKDWRAWVNEIPSEIFVANYTFKGVNVPKGLVRLRFKYH